MTSFFLWHSINDAYEFQRIQLSRFPILFQPHAQKAWSMKRFGIRLTWFIFDCCRWYLSSSELFHNIVIITHNLKDFFSRPFKFNFANYVPSFQLLLDFKYYYFPNNDEPKIFVSLGIIFMLLARDWIL